MSADKKYTEREKVLAQRVAFVAGATFENRAWQRSLKVAYCSGADSIAQSQIAYPLPKSTRRRVVEHDKALFSVGPNGQVECKPSTEHGWFGDTFTRYQAKLQRDPQLLRVLADLIEHPTEEYEENV